MTESHLPGRAEKRPTIETNIRVAQGSGLRLSDLMQTAHAQTEVTVLPVVVIVGSSNSSNSSGSSGGVSHATWYNVQNAYGSGYSNGYNNGFQSGYQAGSNASNTSNQEEESWWNSWGKCAAGVVGDSLLGAGTLGLAGLAAGSFVPGVGTVTVGAIGAIIGGIGGAFNGAVDHC